MKNTTALSIAAVIAVATLVVGIATTVSNATSAYANSSSKLKQTKVVVLNKCANVDNKNKRTHIEDVRCQINNDKISGTGFPLQDGIVLQPP